MKHKLEFFPDGTPIDDWFYDTTAPELSSLGKPYLLTDYGILPIPNKGDSRWGEAWIPVVAPIAGAIVGAFLFKVLFA